MFRYGKEAALKKADTKELEIDRLKEKINLLRESLKKILHDDNLSAVQCKIVAGEALYNLKNLRFGARDE